MTNLMGIFIIATAAILTIIWKMYIKDDEMKSNEILKLLEVVINFIFKESLGLV